MKILSFKYIGGEFPHPLDGFQHQFHSNKDVGHTLPICLAGINGSGKSKLLEKLAEIFHYIINHYIYSETSHKTKLKFELEYIYEGKKDVQIRISQNEPNGIPRFEIIKGILVEKILSKEQIPNYLPSKIIGYTSGQNETLSKFFEASYSEYSDAVTNLARFPKEGPVPDSHFVFLDNNVNSFVFIANSIFRTKKDLSVINNKIEHLDSLESFRIVIQEKPRYKSRLVPISLTPELSSYIASLKKCADRKSVV